LLKQVLHNIVSALSQVVIGFVLAVLLFILGPALFLFFVFLLLMSEVRGIFLDPSFLCFILLLSSLSFPFQFVFSLNSLLLFDLTLLFPGVGLFLQPPFEVIVLDLVELLLGSNNFGVFLGYSVLLGYLSS